MSEITIKDLLKIAQDKRRQIGDSHIDVGNRLAELESKIKSFSNDDLRGMSAYDYEQLKSEVTILKNMELTLRYNCNGALEITDALIEFICDNGLYDAKIIVERK